ncbi:hypothetical protein [Anaeromyxobacter sp. SG66]|uniref:hypothetical protein n=1 Tax=Anaeromyxobacter sp. SG66 TaxID=2925410 RepID=UPI001F5811BF|nr:hypothetical protein [Anaeromyxobacter sp. SG66]
MLVVVREHAVSLQVASANLTQSGYRENREVALPLVATEKVPAIAAVVRDALSVAPTYLAPWWSESAEKVRSLALARVERWASDEPAAVEFLWSGGDAALWPRFLAGWPAADRVERLSIVSPFWSGEGEHGPITTLVRELRARDALAANAKVDLFVDAEPVGDSGFRPRLPALGDFDPGALGVSVRVHAVNPLPQDEDGLADVRKLRKLHAKIVILHGGAWELAYAGSANFTGPGWGFGPKANIEAGIRIAREGCALGKALLPPTTGVPVQLTSATLLPAAAAEPEPVVPTFLLDVRLAPSTTSPAELELVVRIDPAKLAGTFSLRDGSGDLELLSAGVGAPEVNHLQVMPEALRRLLLDPRVRVAWWASSEPSEFPVNVDLTARAELPVVAGGGTPDERTLLAYYQGRITLADVYPRPPEWDGDDDGPDVPDPPCESRVDTSRIQAYQVREFVEALQGLRDDLRRASGATEPSMRIALNGPVSPVALARQVKQAALAAERTPTAAGFQLAEIAACLRDAASLVQEDSPWRAYVASAWTSIEQMLEDLVTAHPDVLGSKSFKRYVDAVLRRGGRA